MNLLEARQSALAALGPQCRIERATHHLRSPRTAPRWLLVRGRCLAEGAWFGGAPSRGYGSTRPAHANSTGSTASEWAGGRVSSTQGQRL